MAIPSLSCSLDEMPVSAVRPGPLVPELPGLWTFPVSGELPEATMVCFSVQCSAQNGHRGNGHRTVKGKLWGGGTGRLDETEEEKGKRKWERKAGAGRGGAKEKERKRREKRGDRGGDEKAEKSSLPGEEDRGFSAGPACPRILSSFLTCHPHHHTPSYSSVSPAEPACAKPFPSREMRWPGPCFSPPESSVWRFPPTMSGPIMVGACFEFSKILPIHVELRGYTAAE